MSNEEIRMQELNSSSDELDNELEEAFKDLEDNEESELPRRRLDKKSSSVPPSLVDEDHHEEDLDDDDDIELEADLNDKVGKKRQRKKDDEFGLEKKTKNKKKKKQDLEQSAEINEMWDSITNNKNNSKDGEKVIVVNSKAEEDKAEIAKLFGIGKKKKKKTEKTAAEIAMQVEEVLAKLEIAVEDDVALNREGKPAIHKLLKLPLLSESLEKKLLQAEFLDHGVLNLLKNWLEPLPDGSLPNITIRTAILKILTDFHIELDKDSRREQLIKSGLGKVIMFLSKSEEETIPNKRLANDLINKWGRIIYNKSTRYDNKYSQEEREEHKEILLRKQIKPATSKVSEIQATIDIDLSRKPKFEQGTWKGIGRAQIPKAISMDFKINPQQKYDKKLEARVNMQLDKKGSHENIIDKLKRRKLERRNSTKVTKPSADGRTMLKYL